ncbi:3beta,22alpha-dihydroxysteroid 3-dehydrogenase-like [Silene latifolia]|uniref:3beta,22alpha-dihydroxysteroid 3-dehydrogenase-like n=1 Tax=Silene latifolia TaxID=37657 RepID=UPI003D77B959
MLYHPCAPPPCNSSSPPEKPSTGPIRPPANWGNPSTNGCLQVRQSQQFIEKRVARFGLIFTTHLFGEPTVYSTDTDFNRFVLQNEFKLFESSYPTSISHLVGKHSLLLMKDGNLHKRLHTLTINFAGAANIRDHLFGGIDSLISSVLNFSDGKLFLMEETKKVLFGLTYGKRLFSFKRSLFTNYFSKKF